ncbi:MAG TPA: hypothetical protein VFQ92_13970 [Blastocatellia bacterium]|nr:hypothetical protein [Blastocatellia bacterium]
MNRPGDRITTTCNGCGATILKIVTVRGKMMPADPIPYKVDGKRLPIFPDGVTARRHLAFDLGHQSHFASCP